MSNNNVSLDIGFVRAQFPAFKDPLSAKWSFFENAGGSYVPHNVIEHLNHFMTSTKVQPYAEFDTSAIAGVNMDQATELFADPTFDGEPEQVLIRTEDEINDPENESFDHDINNEDSLNDEGANDHGEDSELPDGLIPNEGGKGSYTKFYVSGVTVHKIAERVQYYGSGGKLVTESFKDYTRKAVLAQFSSLDEFVKRWSEADRKQVVIDELANAGVIWEALEQDVSMDMGAFDLICHVVFDQPALTRRERAENVKKRNYFSKYNDAAQAVLNALLDKYADNGVTEIESQDVLKVTPFDKMGRPREIITKAFGGKPQYEQAISDLEHALYDDQQSA